jgi:hypothetical protein
MQGEDFIKFRKELIKVIRKDTLEIVKTNSACRGSMVNSVDLTSSGHASPYGRQTQSFSGRKERSGKTSQSFSAIKCQWIPETPRSPTSRRPLCKTRIHKFSQRKLETEQEVPDDIFEHELITPEQTLGSRKNSFDEITRGGIASMLPLSNRKEKHVAEGWAAGSFS